MNVSCPECRSVFRVDPAKLPPIAVRARCSVCGGIITVATGAPTDDEFSSNTAAAKVPSSSCVFPLMSWLSRWWGIGRIWTVPRVCLAVHAEGCLECGALWITVGISGKGGG